MEAADEGRRLLRQGSAHPSLARLAASGLRSGMSAIDVGCGSGAVLAEILELVGDRGNVVGLEPSDDRIAEASSLFGDRPNLRFIKGALPTTGIRSESFDYVWCQFVCEYLGDPLPSIRELIRLAKRGGRIVVTEPDAAGLQNWPVPPELDRGVEAMLRALSRVGFDMYIGRKIFHYFRRCGLADVRVSITPMYVAAGTADGGLVEDWRLRFRNLRPLAIGEFESEAAYDAFVRDYLALLENPDALKYSIMVTTEGTRN
jgi:SAM-dependent methyltransferase